MALTVAAVIGQVGRLREHGYDEETLCMWLSELEGQVQVDVMGLDPAEAITYHFEEDQDKELLVGPPHDSIYRLYLLAQIDLTDREYRDYANSMEVFNKAFGVFKAWYLNRHPPGRKAPGVYLTAYGLAVKHGYPGTEEQWLAELAGRHRRLSEMGSAEIEALFEAQDWGTEAEYLAAGDGCWDVVRIWKLCPEVSEITVTRYVPGGQTGVVQTIRVESGEWRDV